MLRSVLAASLIAALAGPAAAAPNTGFIELVQARDCVTLGQQEAANRGGQLGNAREAVQNGTAVCRIVIVIPAANGKRTKRVEVILPRG